MNLRLRGESRDDEGRQCSASHQLEWYEGQRGGGDDGRHVQHLSPRLLPEPRQHSSQGTVWNICNSG